MSFNFTGGVYHTPQGSLACYKFLLGAEGLTSSLKEVVIRIFDSLKNSSLSAWFELANLVSNGSHDYTRPPRTTQCSICYVCILIIWTYWSSFMRFLLDCSGHLLSLRHTFISSLSSTVSTSGWCRRSSSKRRHNFIVNSRNSMIQMSK
jgi:hypothetical protein